MTNQPVYTNYAEYPLARSAADAQRRRTMELLGLIIEGLVTLGIGACFVACAVLVLCIM